MDYDGEVYVCTNDWGRKLSFGNVKEENILDIWMGDRMNEARDRLLKADRCFDPCQGCDVEGTLVGGKHAEAWKHFVP